MKVIQVGTYFHPSVGGVERQMEEIAVNLFERGIEVKVYTTDATHGSQLRMPQMRDFEVYRGIEVYRFRYQLRLGHFFRLSLALLKELWKGDYDIIHIHNTHDGHLLPVLLIKALKHKKLVLTGHNPYVVNEEHRGIMLQRFVGVFEFVLKLLAKHIDTYIALLESEKQTVITKFNLPAERVVVVPNGIQSVFYDGRGDAEKFLAEWELQPQKWKLIVGTASRLTFVKGIQNLRLAAKRLPQVLFVIVGGDDGYLTQLRNIFRSDKNVIFTERYLPSTEVKDFYAAIDLFLLPSIYEPFGMTIVEAMAQHKPVLASNAGGTTEIVKPEFGHLLQPNDQEAWLERISYYIKHKPELAVMGEAAYAASLDYQWSTVIPQIIDVYNNLLQV